MKWIAIAFSSLLAYCWVASFVWSLLPSPVDQWWAFPAYLTTCFCGVACYLIPAYIDIYASK